MVSSPFAEMYLWVYHLMDHMLISIYGIAEIISLVLIKTNDFYLSSLYQGPVPSFYNMIYLRENCWLEI